jgi:FAD synthase
MRVFVNSYLRGEVKFSGLDQLKEQLAKDKVEAQEKLKD